MSLKSDQEFERIASAAIQAAHNIKEQFGLPLALIIVDTLNAAADFNDANDAAEGQRIMNRLVELSRRTGALVLAVDHFGKAVETGTRGTSAKEAAADCVLALLADRDIAGNISNLRMAVRKLRGGSTGAETPFTLKVVELDGGETTCIVEWQREHAQSGRAGTERSRWPQSLRIFKAAMNTALVDSGKVTRPFGSEGPTVRAVTERAVRAEFVARYPVEGEGQKKADAKRNAFNRAIKAATQRELIGSRELEGADWLWFADTKDEADTHTRPDGQDFDQSCRPVRPVVGADRADVRPVRPVRPVGRRARRNAAASPPRLRGRAAAVH